MAEQDIAAPQHRENAPKFLRLDRTILQLALLSPGQGRSRAAHKRFVLELGQGDGLQAHQVVQAEGAIDPVEVLGFNRRALHQQLHHLLGHLVGHLQAHHLPTETALAQALLQGQHQVVGL